MNTKAKQRAQSGWTEPVEVAPKDAASQAEPLAPLVAPVGRQVFDVGEHDDDTGLIGDTPHEGQQLLDDDRCEAHAHLIDEQRAGLLDEGARDSEHLLLAARQ